MKLLKGLPIGYTAHLKDIKLINFTIDAGDLHLYIPQLPLVEIKGQPVISLLDVKLHRLRPSCLFNMFHFTYRHIAFKVLIRDNQLHPDNISRGFFYMHSFTNRQSVARFGKLFTDFNFEYARIKEDKNNFSLRHNNKYINYSLDPGSFVEEDHDLKQALMQIDRAYSVNDDRLKVTRVKRKSLPLQQVMCRHFETNFFEHTRLLGAFCVKEVLNYEWLPPQRCDLR